jgi:hypothetical protein
LKTYKIIPVLQQRTFRGSDKLVLSILLTFRHFIRIFRFDVTKKEKGLIVADITWRQGIDRDLQAGYDWASVRRRVDFQLPHYHVDLKWVRNLYHADFQNSQEAHRPRLLELLQALQMMLLIEQQQQKQSCQSSCIPEIFLTLRG